MGVLTLLAASSASAQDALPPRLVVDLQPGRSVAYAVSARAGDLVIGPFAIARGGPVRFEVFDPRASKIKAAELGGTAETKVGFVAPATGDYRVQFTPSGKEPATISWATTVASPAERMAGRMGAPTVVVESPRIVKLASDLAAGVPDALSRFWAEASAGGGPIIEPLPVASGGGEGGGAGAGAGGRGTTESAQDVLVTFLWREIYETYSVEVLRPPYGPRDYRLMTRLPGTDVWYKTFTVHRTSRFLYWIAPNRREDEDGDVTQLLDPLNPRVFPDERDSWIARNAIDHDPAAAWWSMLSLPDAPDESWVRRIPERRGELVRRAFDSPSLQTQLSAYIYTPPGYSAAAGPYPLVVLFDGSAYATGMAATPTALDNLIAARRLRPTIALFISSSTPAGNRGTNLSNPAFASAVATELVPWLRSTYSISADPKDLVIGGSSAGAVAGAGAALAHPDVFGNVLAMSGGAAVGDLYIASPRVSVRFYIDVGLYEPLFTSDLSFDALVLTESFAVRHRRFRDILRAKGYEVFYRETGGDHSPIHWRATIAEGLMTLLGPASRQP
jgi:enterochelin esterase family protein